MKTGRGRVQKDCGDKIAASEEKDFLNRCSFSRPLGITVANIPNGPGRCKATVLDSLTITHFHKDHTGGLEPIIKEFVSANTQILIPSHFEMVVIHIRMDDMAIFYLFMIG